MITDSLISFAAILDDISEKGLIGKLISSLTKARKNFGDFGAAAKSAGSSLLKFLVSPTGAVIGSVALIATGISHVKKHIEELRQEADEAATEYKESSEAIDDYVKRYQELKQALVDAKSKEEDTYEIKKQLLELQTEINSKFGEEYEKLNLITGSYADLTSEIEKYNKVKAEEFLHEESRQIEKAKKNMEAESSYVLGTVNRFGDGAGEKELKALFEKYANQGVRFEENVGTDTYSVILDADPKSAEKIMNSIASDLSDAKNKYAHLFEDEFYNIFNTALGTTLDSLSDSQEIIDKWGNIYEQALMAEIATDKNKSATMLKAEEAINAYNEAVLKAEDPFTDEDVAVARQNLEKIKQEMSGEDWIDYSSIVNDLFNGANTALYDFGQKLKNDRSLQKYASEIYGLDEIDVRAMLDYGVYDAFDKLAEEAEKAGVDVEGLINTLIEFGWIKGKVSNNQTDIIGMPDLDELNKQMDSIQSSFKGLSAACEEYNTHGYLTMDTLQELLSLDSQYLACLINENGQLQINGKTYEALVKAKLADAEAAAIKQAITELNAVTTESEIEADSTSIGIMAEKSKVLAILTGNYSALAETATSAATAQALADGFTKAYGKNQEEANRIMSNLNAKLALIRSTSEKTAGSFGNLTNHLNGFTNASDEATDAMERQKEALEKEKDALEKQKEHYEEVIDAINWFYDQHIEKVQDLIEELEEQNELLSEQQENYDMALSAINRFYQNQIELIQEEQEAIDKRIEALQEENDERKKQYELEQKQLALERARNQKTALTYTADKGYVYMADETAIKDAESDLADAEFDNAISQLEKERESLQESIDKLEEYRELWGKVADEYQEGLEDIQMQQALGAEWESILLEGRIEAVTSFKDQYIAVQTQINDNEQLIASYEEKIEYYESLKEEWEKLTNKYQEETYTQLLIGEFGNNYEDELLNGRTQRWEDFAIDYANIQSDLKDITDKIELLAQQMEEYESRIKTSAENMTKHISNMPSGIPQVYIPSGKSGGGTTKTAYGGNYQTWGGKAKGGIIDEDDTGSLDPFAHAVGEDHMVALTEGEAVIPVDTVKANPELVNGLLNANGKSYTVAGNSFSRNGSTFTPVSIPSLSGFGLNGFNLNSVAPKFNNKISPGSYVNNIINGNGVNITIGDIHLSGVQDVNGLSNAIINKLPNTLVQALWRI